MKQYKSIQITERDMLRLIDKLYCYQKICKGYMPMDDEFFEYMSFMPREKVIQAINSMYDKELIKNRSDTFLNPRYISLTGKAFTFKMDMRKENFRWWVPTVISILALLVSIAAITISIKLQLQPPN